MRPPHEPGCVRGAWLLEQLVTQGLAATFRDALLSLGPECSCPVTGATVQPLNSR